LPAGKIAVNARLNMTSRLLNCHDCVCLPTIYEFGRPNATVSGTDFTIIQTSRVADAIHDL
jgi:hypothetical protein